MKIRCAWCLKTMGKKEPNEDNGFTDAICDQCLNHYFPHVAEIINKAHITEKDRYPEYTVGGLVRGNSDSRV